MQRVYNGYTYKTSVFIAAILYSFTYMQDSSLQDQYSTTPSTRSPQTSTNINSGSLSSQFQESADANLLSNPAVQELRVTSVNTPLPAAAVARTNILLDVLLIIFSLTFALAVLMAIRTYLKKRTGRDRIKTVEEITEALEEIAEAVEAKTAEPTPDTKSQRKKSKKKRNSKKKKR